MFESYTWPRLYGLPDYARDMEFSMIRCCKLSIVPQSFIQRALVLPKRAIENIEFVS
jgi:hypothetical protein